MELSRGREVLFGRAIHLPRDCPFLNQGFSAFDPFSRRPRRIFLALREVRVVLINRGEETGRVYEKSGPLRIRSFFHVAFGDRRRLARSHAYSGGRGGPLRLRL